MDVDRTARLALLFSEALRRRRLSVYRLSKESGVALKTTQKVIAGQSPEPSFWTVVGLAHTLGLSLDALGADTQQETRRKGVGTKKRLTRPRE
jgi:hypothetical protein